LRPYRLNLPRSERTVACRAVSSDIGAFTQIFVQRQYDGLVTDRTRPLTILDCGANVGYASVFFLETFPQARVIAIEPDADNFALLTRNLEPWRDRVTTIQAALWPVAGTVHLQSAPPGSLNEWGTMVDESRQDGVVVDAIDPAGVLARCPGRRIDVMKIDIEGAEALLFAEGDRTWMGAVDTFAIELHGDACERSFRSALSDGDWRSWQVGEITVARRASVPD
jgi:FkbM family methyltransferase